MYPAFTILPKVTLQRDIACGMASLNEFSRTSSCGVGDRSVYLRDSVMDFLLECMDHSIANIGKPVSRWIAESLTTKKQSKCSDLDLNALDDILKD